MAFIYDMIIGPIEFIVDLVFTFFNHYVSGGAIAICGVSVAINMLALPLYNIADKIQNQERDLQNKLLPRVKKIKAAFKGDEQFLILSEYYRQNNYHPLYSLRNSLSILIQIPFFMAAYNYLSNCPALQDTGFLFLKDLSVPDSLYSIKLGSTVFAINILPIIMTLINVVASAIYTKGFPLKEKVQVYGLALVFLVLLYNSPSGLVFYWILNNLFSLGKNIVLKTKHPGKILYALVTLGLLSIVGFFWIEKRQATLWKKLAFTVFALIVIVTPIIINLIKKFIFTKKSQKAQISSEQNKSFSSIFVLSCLVISITLGLVLSTSVISTSPTEFSFLGSIESPISFVFHNTFFFLGFFTLWPILLAKMFKFNKKYLSFTFFIVAICVLTNIYLFKHSYGNINPLFILDNPISLEETSILQQIGPFFVIIAIAFLLHFIYNAKNKKNCINYISFCLIAILLGEFALSFTKLNSIKTEYLSYKETRNNLETTKNSEKSLTKFNLTKTGQNVIVLFLDRAMPEFFPYALIEFPELKQSFKGFTFYPNCLSYGPVTATGTPAMFAGYEYTPENINKRDSELLVDKHNEALLVMPRLFSDANFDVTVSDTPWTNYSWIPDWTPFKKYPEIKTHRLSGTYTSEYYKKINSELTTGDEIETIDVSIACNKQLSNFCILQAILPSLRKLYYDVTNFSSASSTQKRFTEFFSALYLLNEFTDFTNTKNTYNFIGNDSTHEWTFLNTPEFNLEVNKKSMNIKSDYKFKSDDIYKAYQVNIAAIKRIGVFLDYLKENDCYDNTRFIIVSDHGNGISLDSFDSKIKYMGAALNCLLLVKDFNCNESIKTDYSLMTNADTIFFAKKDLPVSNVNPFTKNEFVNQKEKDNKVVIRTEKSSIFNATYLINKTQFNLDGNSYEVKDSIYKAKNWRLLEDK